MRTSVGGPTSPAHRRPPYNLDGVTAPVDPPPVTVAPPPQVRAAGWVVLGQAALVMAVATVVILARKDADLRWAAATAAYFVVLAVLIGAVGRGLLQGRRWARTPAIVSELIFALVGFYLAVPSGRPLPGAAMILIGVTAAGLLLSRAANDWVRKFPSLFGPAPDR